MVIVAASGYFNPIHSGHIEYLERAKKLGDKLIVIINSDFQQELKGSKKFQTEKERMLIVSSLRCVDEVFLSIDQDTSVSKSLEIIKPNIFAKGGDRFSSEIPESQICKLLGIKIIDGLGDEIQSSSNLLKQI